MVNLDDLCEEIVVLSQSLREAKLMISVTKGFER